MGNQHLMPEGQETTIGGKNQEPSIQHILASARIAAALTHDHDFEEMGNLLVLRQYIEQLPLPLLHPFYGLAFREQQRLTGIMEKATENYNNNVDYVYLRYFLSSMLRDFKEDTVWDIITLFTECEQLFSRNRGLEISWELWKNPLWYNRLQELLNYLAGLPKQELQKVISLIKATWNDDFLFARVSYNPSLNKTRIRIDPEIIDTLFANIDSITHENAWLLVQIFKTLWFDKDVFLEAFNLFFLKKGFLSEKSIDAICKRIPYNPWPRENFEELIRSSCRRFLKGTLRAESAMDNIEFRPTIDGYNVIHHFTH